MDNRVRSGCVGCWPFYSMLTANVPVADILRRYGLRPTAVRQAVLQVLRHSPWALSGGELEKQLSLAFDRIAVYRTLCTFEQKALVHRVVDYGETVRYAMSSPAPEATPHAHFKCTACQRLYCLRHVVVPAVEVPAPLRVTTWDCLFSGVCAQCQPR